MALGMGGPVVARARTVIDTDSRGVDKGLAQAERTFDSRLRGIHGIATRIGGAIRAALRVAFIAVGVALTAGTLAAVKFTRAATDLGEEINKANVVFGRSAAGIQRWSKTTSSSLGISRRAALEFSGVFGNMLVPMGFARAEAAKMSRGLVELGADMASFNNASPEEVLEALRAGLSGETEPLRRFGVFLNEARIRQEALNQGLIKGTEELTAAEKAAATYAIILKDTKDAQGDVARTSDSLANRERRLRAKLEDVAAGFGKFLIPAAEAGAEKLEGVIDFLDKVSKAKSPRVAVHVAIAGIRGGLDSLREQLGGLLLGEEGRRVRVPVDARHWEWKVVGGRKGLLEDLEGWLLGTFDQEAMFGSSGARVRVPVEGGRFEWKIEGGAEGWVDALERELTGASDSIDWDRVGNVIGRAGSGVFQLAGVLAAVLARTIGKAIREIDWVAIGGEIQEGMKKGLKHGIEGLADAVTPEELQREFEKEGMWDWDVNLDLDTPNTERDVNSVIDKVKGLFGVLEDEAHGATRNTAATWAGGMDRIRDTSARALASVIGNLSDTSTSGLRAKDQIEALRGELNRVPTKKNVQVDVQIAFFGSGGVRFNPRGVSGADGVISAAIRGAVSSTVGNMSPAAFGVRPRPDVTPALWDEVAIGAGFGLGVSSTYRPGAITSTGNPSLHGVYPAQAVDMSDGSSSGYGSAAMRGAFHAMIGRPGVDEVILSPYWWHPGGGITRIPAGAGSVLRDHWDHVHVGDRAGDGLVGLLRSPWSTATGDGIRGLPKPARRPRETAAEYRRRLADVDIARLPASIELAIAKAELTRRATDDIQAWRRAERRLLRARRTRWITTRQRIGVLRELNSVRDTLASLREERDEQSGRLTPQEAEAQARAFAEARHGFFKEFAPNIFTPTPAGLVPGSTPLGSGQGGGSVTVNQYFHKPPEDPHPLLRSAEFAAQGVFG